MKVLSCVKVLLIGMRVDRFASCENFVPRLQTKPRLVSSP